MDKDSVLVCLSSSDQEEEEDADEGPTQLDKEIEQEEKQGDNIVIKDLEGSVRPEPNKVRAVCFRNVLLNLEK